MTILNSLSVEIHLKATFVSDYFWCSRLLQTPKPFKDYLLVRNGYEKLNHLESNKGRGDHFYTQFEFIEINEALILL